jgi:hypothetical protein
MNTWSHVFWMFTTFNNTSRNTTKSWRSADRSTHSIHLGSLGICLPSHWTLRRSCLHWASDDFWLCQRRHNDDSWVPHSAQAVPPAVCPRAQYLPMSGPVIIGIPNLTCSLLHTCLKQGDRWVFGMFKSEMTWERDTEIPILPLPFTCWA